MPVDLSRYTPARRALLQRLLRHGLPTLWCPLLTHYRAEGGLDTGRMRRHLDSLSGSVQGLLVPGSTGDGWQLGDAEVRELLSFLLPEARTRGMAVLIGVLEADSAAMLASLRDTSAWLRGLSAAESDEAALIAAGVCSFTVCPPAGAALSQQEIRDALDQVLATGLPMALYQLPQVTQNEMSPETVAGLAQRHPNFLYFKDTSGAEGHCSRHLASQRGNRAEQISQHLAAVVETVFAAAAQLPFGNAFTNANKAIDHFMAHPAPHVTHTRPEPHRRRAAHPRYQRPRPVLPHRNREQRDAGHGPRRKK